MPPDLSDGEMLEAAGRDIREAMMAAFCAALQGTRLPPLALVELTAEALGSIYREVADAHCGNRPCPCGWQPCPAADLEALQAALKRGAALSRHPDLARMAVAGRA
ncbi:hypothetical protein AB4Y99_14470 [Bosea sp. TAB14]